MLPMFKGRILTRMDMMQTNQWMRKEGDEKQEKYMIK